MSEKMTNMRHIRESRNLTQNDVADVLKVDQKTYQRYESGEVPISSDKLVKLANLFHTSTDYLLGYVPTEYPKELAYVEAKESGEIPDADIAFEIRTPAGDEDIDGGLIHVIECYKACGDKEKEHIQYMVDRLAKLVLMDNGKDTEE